MAAKPLVDEWVINRTVILESEVNEVLAYFYMCRDRIIAVSTFSMFAIYERAVNDPRVLPGSPWMMTDPIFLDYIGRICAYTPARYHWTLRHTPTGAFTALTPEVSAASLANTTGIDAEEVREHQKNYLVFRKALEDREKIDE